jgi:hypothetical protein
MSLKHWSRSVLPTLILLALPALSMAQISVNVSVDVAPPELPVYDQPPIPDDGYIWTPGYWAWDDNIQDYYWVPGTWVLAPQPDFLWTPGYWGWAGGVFLWHAGYWGPHVGFYGGVDYGHGYGGHGYEGGYWQGGHLFYNRSVTNIGTTNITNVYNRTVINKTVNRVSFNGGTGGVRAQPTAEEQSAERERHIATVPAQHQHEAAARNNPTLRASANQGHPPIAATPRPGAFSGKGVVEPRQGTFSVTHANPPPAPDAAPPGRGATGEVPPQQRRTVESRPAPTEPRPTPEPRAAVESHRQPEQTPPPRPSAPPPPQPRPQAQPHPAEHPPEHKDDHEHH